MSDPPSTKDWSEISVYSDSAVGTARSAASKVLRELRNVLTDETKGLIAKGEFKFNQLRCTVGVDFFLVDLHFPSVSYRGKQNSVICR